MTIRVFEAFSGVGSQRMALRNLGIDHEVVAVSDVDEFTVKSYAAIHDSDKSVSEVSDEEMQDYLEKRNIPLNDKGVRKNLKGKKLKEFYEACIKSNNLGDISKVETHDIPDHDLFTYSFPCQDISVAGKGSGLDEGSDTRSGLLWECQKVIYGKRPKYLLLENVKNLVGKKHKHNFDKWLEWLEKQGYTNYHQILNAKDYGVPQNRERVFVVSILGHHEPYEFPEPIELELRLKDVLEDVVDERYYLDNEKANKLISTVASKHEINEPTPTDGGLKKPKPREVANTITARYDAGVSNQQSMGTMVIEPNNKKDSDSLAVGFIPRTNGTQHQSNTVYRIDKESPSVSATDYKNPIKVLLDNDTIDNEPKAERLGGIFDKDGTKHQAGAVWDKDHLSPALDTMQGGWRQPSVVEGADRNDYRIRKLTPKECWRLMGFSDDDFHKAEGVNSNTQLYKQAGNSIVVDVLEGIFKQLLEEHE